MIQAVENLEFIVFMEYPRNRWWNTGLDNEEYEGDNNKALCRRLGIEPDHDLAQEELDHFKRALEQSRIPYVELAFPEELAELDKWDSVFITDHGIVTKEKDGLYIAGFGERQRQPEIEEMKKTYEALGLQIIDGKVSGLEGGDTIVNYDAGFIISGNQRNKKDAAKAFADEFDLELFIAESKLFHVDGAIACVESKNPGFSYKGIVLYLKEAIENKDEFEKFVEIKGYLPLGIDASDAKAILITDSDDRFDSMALNFRQYGNKVFSPLRLQTPSAEELITEAGLTHIITPFTQYRMFGSGADRCATFQVRLSQEGMGNAFEQNRVRSYYIPHQGVVEAQRLEPMPQMQ